MPRQRHPNKDIESALRQLEKMGWSVEVSKGKSAHAWGFVRCPENAKEKCRNGVFCQSQVWSTPRNPTNHASALLRQSHGCVIKREE